jgi:hypothetical protein
MSFAGEDLFSNELEGKRERFTFIRRRIVCTDELSVHAFGHEGV